MSLPPLLRIPVVVAPMFLISGPELVIAACRSGVVGSFPSPNCRTVSQLDEWLDTISSALREDAPDGQERPVAPWAINLITHQTNARLAEDLRLVAEYRPPVVITALGSPAPVLEVVKGYGGTVIADVVNLRLARKAAAVGVDGLACIAAGAGGHTGHLSPFAFVSGVREFFDGLVVVGGGISDGNGVAGAIASGADLVYMGTRFLATTESLAVPEYKRMVVDHGPDDLVVSAGITGTDASWLRPSLLANGLDPEALEVPTARDYNSAAGVGARWKSIWAAGQGLQTIHSIDSTATVVEQLETEFHTAAQRFAARSRPAGQYGRPAAGVPAH